MSIHLMSLVWEVRFPTQGQKLVMLRMADFANDEGDSVFPSNSQVAEQCGLTKRGAQYILRGFHNCGLMVITKEGGSGPKSTNQRKIDVDLLIELALANRTLEGSKDDLKVVDKKGELSAPRTLLRVNSIALRVNSKTDKGEPQCTRSFINHHIESSSASADARDGSRTSPAGEKPPLTMIELTPSDVSWREWIALMENEGRTDLADKAIDSGKLRVSTRWPNPERGLQDIIGAKPRKIVNITNRITGDRS